MLLGGVEWAGVSEVRPGGQVCMWGGGGVKAGPALWLVLPVWSLGPFTAVPLRLGLRNEDSATDELFIYLFSSSDEFFNMPVT